MQLVITVNQQGQVNVQGPIDNKVLAYGLLELAKEAICEHHRRNESTAIVPAMALPAGLKR